MRLVLAVLAALVAAPVLAAPAQARIPVDWLGVMADGPLLHDPRVDLDRELRIAHRARVRNVRVAVAWSVVQPYRTWDDVPADQRDRFTDVGGAPLDLTATDRIVGAAARRGLRTLPVVLTSPAWAATDPSREFSEPRDPAQFARFAGALVRRYGRGGTFWRSQRPQFRRPVRAWQVWNEPNLGHFWAAQPFAPSYVKLLRATRKSIRGADRRAKVVLGGVTNGARLSVWEAMERIYRAGGRKAFDAVAIHPYTASPRNVVVSARRVRRVMARYGDARKPLWLTELSWSSSNRTSRDGYATWDTSERGQARRVRQALTALARERRRLRIAAVYWYTWLSPQVSKGYWTEYSGLRKLRSGRAVSKPALKAFRDTARRLRR